MSVMARRSSNVKDVKILVEGFKKQISSYKKVLFAIRVFQLMIENGVNNFQRAFLLKKNL